MSAVGYNGVYLPYCHITKFEMNDIYDDVAGVDYLYTEYDIHVQSIINENYLMALAPDLLPAAQAQGSMSPAIITKVVRDRLKTPRKPLSVSFAGVELIPTGQTIPGGTVVTQNDANNGPLPQSVSIYDLTNQTFMVDFHVKAWYRECLADVNGVIVNLPSNPVISSRWSETIDIDARNFTVRTRTGQLVIRSDAVSVGDDNNPLPNLNADYFRSSAVLGVPNGFLRDSSQYILSEDATTLSFRVVDKEYFKNPPKPSFRADGEYIESAVTVGIAATVTRRLAVRVHLEGDKGIDQNGNRYTNQWELVSTACRVATAKLSINGATFYQPAGDTKSSKIKSWLERCAIMVKLYDNVVEVNMSAMAPPRTTPTGEGRFNGIWGINFDGLCFTPLSDTDTLPGASADDQPWTSRPYLQRGSAGLLMQAASFYDPCLQGSDLKSVDVSTNRLTTLEARPATVRIINNTLNPTDTKAVYRAIVDDNLTQTNGTNPRTPNISMFADYEIKSRYERDQHVYAMPTSTPYSVGSQPTVFVQLAQPSQAWIVDWTATKINEQPEIPRPTTPTGSNGAPEYVSNWVLLDQQVEPCMIRLGPDGFTPIYSISGTYIYGCKRPSSRMTADVAFAIAPWMQGEYNDGSVYNPFFQSMPASKYMDDLISQPYGSASNSNESTLTAI